MAYELIERDGVVFAEIIWAGTSVDKTRFFSHEKSSFQFGLLAHKAGFVEEAHYHKSVQRSIGDVQQMFVVQRGKIAVDFYTVAGEKFREITLQTRGRDQSDRRRARNSRPRGHAVHQR